jgi:hypothetical protein
VLRHARVSAQALSVLLLEHGISKASFEVIHKHLLKEFSGYDNEPALIKEIKASLAFWCARRLLQKELPAYGKIRFFPDIIVGQVRMRTSLRTKGSVGKKLRLIHSIGQVKKAFAQSPRELVQQYYEKHRATLSSVTPPTPTEYLNLAFANGKKLGKIVKKIYNPYKTSMPTASATFDTKRSDGGKKAALFKKNTPQNQFRVEPTVLYLCGLPGVGKSRLVSDIIRCLAVREGLDPFECVYTRSCGTPHWDGYVGQAITVLDDWAQDATQRVGDILELISLVTDNAYPLPMADLKEKGTLFTSRYMIVCSNQHFGSLERDHTDAGLTANNSYILRDDRAVLRRLHHPYAIHSAQGDEVVSYQLDLGSLSSGPRFIKPSVPIAKELFKREKRCSFIANVVTDLVKDHMHRAIGVLRTIPELACDYPWVQEVYNVDDWTMTDDGNIFRLKASRSFSFNPIPPPELPRVMAHAVPKELGARIITKSDEFLHVLKPFQMALSKALGTMRRFGPTRGVPLNEMLSEMRSLEEDEYYLSGDYESATDGMHMDFSKAIIEGILSEIDHEPTAMWARYEHGEHIVHYPSETGLSPIKQTVGQLMGSLLSFPILCVANDTLCEIAGISEKDRMINGDDLWAITNRTQYEKWKEAGARCGMKPSVGKNFLSRRFATFNSQLIMGNKVAPYTNLKLIMRDKVQDELNARSSRKGQVVTLTGCLSKALEQGVSKQTLVRNNKSLLERTVQSIDISTAHGGLGFESTREMTYTDKLCYMCKLLPDMRRLPKSLHAPPGYVWLAYPVRGQFVKETDSLHGQLSRAILDTIASDNDSTQRTGFRDTLNSADIRRVHKRVVNSKTLREMLKKMSVHRITRLDDGFTNTEVVCVPKSSEKSLWISKLREFINDVQMDNLV